MARVYTNTSAVLDLTGITGAPSVCDLDGDGALLACWFRAQNLDRNRHIAGVANNNSASELWRLQISQNPANGRTMECRASSGGTVAHSVTENGPTQWDLHVAAVLGWDGTDIDLQAYYDGSSFSTGSAVTTPTADATYGDLEHIRVGDKFAWDGSSTQNGYGRCAHLAMFRLTGSRAQQSADADAVASRLYNSGNGLAPHLVDLSDLGGRVTLVIYCPFATDANPVVGSATVSGESGITYDLNNEPAVQVYIEMPSIASTAQVFAPTLSAQAGSNDTLTAPTINTTAATYIPTLSAQSNESIAAPHIASTATPHEITLSPQANTEFAAPAIAGAVALFTPTVSDQANPSLEAPFIASGATLAEQSLVAQSNDSLSLPLLTLGVSLFTMSLDDQTAETLTNPFIGSTLNLFTPVPTLQGSPVITIPFLGSTLVTQAPVLTDQGNDSLAIPVISSTYVGHEISLSAQGNESLSTPVLTLGTSLFAPVLDIPSVNQLVTPFIGSGENLFVPALELQTNTSLTLAAIAPGEQLFETSLVAQSNDSLALPALTGVVTINTPTLSAQNYIEMPVLASSYQGFSPTFSPAANETLVVPEGPAGVATLFAPTFPTTANDAITPDLTISQLLLFSPGLQRSLMRGFFYFTDLTIDYLKTNLGWTALDSAHWSILTRTDAQLNSDALDGTFINDNAVMTLRASSQVTGYKPEISVVFRIRPQQGVGGTICRLSDDGGGGPAKNVRWDITSPSSGDVQIFYPYDQSLGQTSSAAINTSLSTPGFNIRDGQYHTLKWDIGTTYMRLWEYDHNTDSYTLLGEVSGDVDPNNTLGTPYKWELRYRVEQSSFGGDFTDMIQMPAAIPSQLQLFEPQLQADANPVIVVPEYAPTTQVFAPTFSIQGGNSFVAPFLDSTAIVYTPDLQLTPVDALVAPVLNSTLTLGTPVLSSIVNAVLAVPTIPSTVQVFSPTLDVPGVSGLSVPFIASTSFVSPIKLEDPLNAVIEPSGPRMLGRNVGFFRDWQMENPFWNRRIVNHWISGIGTDDIISGQWDPTTGWFYAAPGQSYNLRPLRTEQSNGYEIDPGIWVLKAEIIPNTGGGLGVENQPNTATITCVDFNDNGSTATIIRKTHDITGETDGRVVIIDGGANGGWIKVLYWGHINGENTPYAWHPDFLTYMSDGDLVRLMDWGSINQSKMTRHTDWIDDSDVTIQGYGSDWPSSPPAFSEPNRLKIKGGFSFGMGANLALATDQVLWMPLPSCIGAHSIEATIWANNTVGSANQVNFRADIAAAAPQILIDAEVDFYELALKAVQSLIDQGYEDKRPVIFELSNEPWNSNFRLQHWYFNGIGVYIQGRNNWSGSDNGIGYGWILAIMMRAFKRAFSLLKPNQLYYFPLNIQTTGSSYRADGALRSIRQYLIENPDGVDLDKVFISPTSYNRGAYRYQSLSVSGGVNNPYGANSALEFAALFEQNWLISESWLFKMQEDWYVERGRTSGRGNWAIIDDHVRWLNYAISNGCRGIMDYEGSNHDNLDGGPKNQDLLTVYPNSANIWKRFSRSPNGQVTQEDMLNMLMRIGSMNPNINDGGWMPKGYINNNYMDIGRDLIPNGPWIERLPTEKTSWPPVGMAAAWGQYAKSQRDLASGNDYIRLPTCTNATILYTPQFTNSPVVVPFIQSTLQFFTPLMQDTALNTLSPQPIDSTLQLFVPTLDDGTPVGTDLIDVPTIPSSVQLHTPTFAIAANVTLQHPFLSVVPGVFAPNLVAQGGNAIVAPSLVLGVTLYAPDILEQSRPILNAPALASTAVVYPPTLSAGLEATWVLPFIHSTVSLDTPYLYDNVVGIPDPYESNPFEPNIPDALAAALPLEGAAYMQNLAETLRDVYEQMQEGSVAYPAYILGFVDQTPRAPVGTKGRFLHKTYGFIVAEYVQFYEDAKVGAPVGLCKFDLDKATTVFANAQPESGFGILATVNAPKAGEFAWVITEGRSLIPLQANTDLSPGDEVSWTADGQVESGYPGVILARYRGASLTAGQSIRAGDLDISKESSTANKLLTEITSINAQLQSLILVDDNQAQALTNLTVAVAQFSAQLQNELLVRADSDSALARTMTSLSATLRNEITASYNASIQAMATADAAILVQLETAKTSFFDALNPLNTRVSQALSETSLLADAQRVTAGSINMVAADLDAVDLLVQGNASAISTLQADVSTIGGQVSANSSAITTVQSSITTLNGSVSANATAITSLNTSVTTINGQISTVQAEWGVQVDVNGRVTGTIKLSADQSKSVFSVSVDKFQIWNGATDTPIFEAANGLVYIAGIPLNDGVFAEDGNNLRPIGVGVAQGVAMDGVAVSFSKTWSSVPAVIFGGGGKVLESTFGNHQEHIYRALNPTTSGFTPSLKIRNVTGTETNVTDTGATATTGGPTLKIDKSASLPDKNDSYVFQYDASVPIPPPTEPGGNQVTVRIYTRTTSGGAWIQRASAIHTSSVTNATLTASASGLGATAQFGILFLYSNITGAFSFDSVKYTTTTGGATTSATPAGNSGVEFTVIGNKETL